MVSRRSDARIPDLMASATRLMVSSACGPSKSAAFLDTLYGGNLP